MKGKRVLSLALAALMTLSLLVVPAAAVSFTDMTNHWAKDDVEYLATQGVVKGTSATTFAPDQKMTACEALLFCSRAAGVDAIDKEAIAEDWEDELKEILPEEMYAWAAQEMAVCLETGIISETELRALSSAGGLVKSMRYLLLPAIALGLQRSASLARVTRSSMLDVLNSDYIRTARSKGLRERAVVYVHALKNAMNQIITQLGISIAHLLGGAIVMENVFNIPGLGRLAFDSIVRRDYPVIQAHILYVAFIYVIVNLVVDLLYKFFDPRIEYK